MNVAYDKGLHELGDGLFAYLQPDGGWGWSNAGLITAGGTSLLVDTLYDLKLTAEMLEAMAPVTQASPIDAALNTHANPDHCFGNELLPTGTEIYASRAAAEEMAELSPELLQSLKDAVLPPDLRAFVDLAFGPFDFSNISFRAPSQTFAGRLDVNVGDRAVTFIELGPAHTGGDTIVHVPDAQTVFTGDLLFIDGTPIVWADLDNWLTACDRILELDARVLVPGHGPVTDAGGVRDVQRYLRFVRDEARTRFDAGMDVETAADDIDITDFADWGDPERIVANVEAAYRSFDPDRRMLTPAENILRMAGWRSRHRGR
ncbi:MAG: metallo-beta-lactamase family protein [Solirubrobacteraceae bacterium]|nr:metallo-beta-lactamase family protein [Solirubrobacteraceae bacterium]